MAKIYFIKCYLSRPQYEQVRVNAFRSGFRGLSGYARWVLAGDGARLMEVLAENNMIIKRVERILAARGKKPA
ncbi:hypothetical protein C4580_04935 [Candidatus Woesearchaeota archaeon]|nr:MAG: hypothetical protein C4580_04935 [Candidatus Woesearchaeota archaeon]